MVVVVVSGGCGCEWLYGMVVVVSGYMVVYGPRSFFSLLSTTS